MHPYRQKQMASFALNSYQFSQGHSASSILLIFCCVFSWHSIDSGLMWKTNVFPRLWGFWKWEHMFYRYYWALNKSPVKREKEFQTNYTHPLGHILVLVKWKEIHQGNFVRCKPEELKSQLSKLFKHMLMLIPAKVTFSMCSTVIDTSSTCKKLSMCLRILLNTVSFWFETWKQSIAKEALCQDDKNQWVPRYINNNHITLVRTHMSLPEHQIQQRKNKKNLSIGNKVVH